MSHVTMSGMTRWLAAALVALVALHGTADAQAFKKKSSKPAATAKKAPAKKAVKKSKAKKSHVADSSRADDLTPEEDEKPTKLAKGGKGKKAKQLAPEEEDDYIVIEDDEE